VARAARRRGAVAGPLRDGNEATVRGTDERGWRWPQTTVAGRRVRTVGAGVVWGQVGARRGRRVTTGGRPRGHRQGARARLGRPARVRAPLSEAMAEVAGAGEEEEMPEPHHGAVGSRQQCLGWKTGTRRRRGGDPARKRKATVAAASWASGSMGDAERRCNTPRPMC